MILNYARLNFMQLRTIRDDSSCLWQMRSDPRFDGAASFEVREEFINASMNLCNACVSGRLHRSADPTGPPAESLQLAVNGNGGNCQKYESLDLGNCQACVLNPVQVQVLSSGLKALCTANHLSPSRWQPSPFGLPDWRRTSSTPPAIALLKCFYATAAAYGQYVMVARTPRLANAGRDTAQSTPAITAAAPLSCPSRFVQAKVECAAQPPEPHHSMQSHEVNASLIRFQRR